MSATGDRQGLIDVHCHYLPEAYTDGLAAAGQGVPDNIPGMPSWSLEQALETMDALGIDSSILSISSPGIVLPDHRATVALARAVNDAGAETVAAAPDRFGFFAALPLPHVRDAVAELARSLDELGADGIALMTNAAGCYIADPRMEPILAELDARGSVVFVHPTAPPNHDAVSFGRPIPMLEFPFDTTRAVTELILSGAADRYPGIDWIIPHAGSALPVLASRVSFVVRELALSTTALDIEATLRRFHYDVAGPALPILLPALVELVGHDRLLYGSDTPFTSTATAESLAAALRDSNAFGGVLRNGAPRRTAQRLFPRLAGQPV